MRRSLGRTVIPVEATKWKPSAPNKMSILKDAPVLNQLLPRFLCEDLRAKGEMKKQVPIQQVIRKGTLGTSANLMIHPATVLLPFSLVRLLSRLMHSLSQSFLLSFSRQFLLLVTFFSPSMVTHNTSYSNTSQYSIQHNTLPLRVGEMERVPRGECSRRVCSGSQSPTRYRS